MRGIPSEMYKTGQIGRFWAAFLPKHTSLDRLDHVRHSYRNTHDWTYWTMCGILTETHMTGQAWSGALLEKHTRLDRFYPEKSDRSVPVQSCRTMQNRHWILRNPTQAYTTGQIWSCAILSEHTGIDRLDPLQFCRNIRDRKCLSYVIIEIQPALSPTVRPRFAIQLSTVQFKFSTCRMVGIWHTNLHNYILFRLSAV